MIELTDNELRLLKGAMDLLIRIHGSTVLQIPVDEQRRACPASPWLMRGKLVDEYHERGMETEEEASAREMRERFTRVR
jgi:hypothetical protein